MKDRVALSASAHRRVNHSRLDGAQMSEAGEAVRATKVCPICAQSLSLSEFGVCRARKDGLNLYCKTCIRRKVTESRRALKEYKTARKKYVADAVLETEVATIESSAASPIPYSRLASRLSPVDRVREAIRRGARTQKEIAQETKLGKDEIGDALANLLLWTREVRTEIIDNQRVYFVNECPEALVAQDDGPRIPRRKRDVPSSFSALQGLMPGRNPEGEPEKIGGWVAA
jgi:hypothetical protein